jgi:hypothetical protein
MMAVIAFGQPWVKHQMGDYLDQFLLLESMSNTLSK